MNYIPELIKLQNDPWYPVYAAQVAILAIMQLMFGVCIGILVSWGLGLI